MAWTPAETPHTVIPKAVKQAQLTAQLSRVSGVRAGASDPVQRGREMREMRSGCARSGLSIQYKEKSIGVL